MLSRQDEIAQCEVNIYILNYQQIKEEVEQYIKETVKCRNVKSMEKR